MKMLNQWLAPKEEKDKQTTTCESEKRREIR